jgi:hypothetical protein
MPLISKASSAVRTSLTYITVGALTMVWTAVYFAYLLNRYGSQPLASYYWCAGFAATGLTLLVIGLAVGYIGRSARHAELPPKEVTPAVANAMQVAAARAPMMAPNPAAPILNPGIPAGYPGAMMPTPAGQVPQVAAAPGTPAVGQMPPQV